MMNEEVLSQPADNFLALRDKYNPELIKTQFKTQMVGGFNQEEVTKYIQQIKEDYKSFEKEMRSEINELLSSRSEIEKTMGDVEQLRESYDKACYDLQAYAAECGEKDSEIGQLQTQICQLTDHREELKKLLGEAGQEIGRLMEELGGFEEEKNLMKMKIAEFERQVTYSEELESRNLTLAEIIAEKDAELDELRRISEEALQELKEEKAKSLNSEIAGFKDEFASIYSRIESISGEQRKINGELQQKLDEQVRLNEELQQKLEAENLRAAKAESDQASLMRCVSDLFCEQDHIEKQISQLAERRSEIGGRLASLQELL
jgi:chromosome segregation ATPase